MALALGLAGGGCSTPGPAHAYLYAPASDAATLRDLDPLTGAEIATVPAFATEGEKVVGLAYDPFTDHLFLRIFPGNRIRVVDRPAGAIKRVFTAPSLPLGGHDLAIRSRDRHLFFTDPTGPALIETDLYGDFEDYHRLEGLVAPVWGVAHDARRDELWVLPDETGDRLLRFTPKGVRRGEVRLEKPVRGVSLAYDQNTRTLLASLANGSGIGVFAEDGRLLRTLPAPSAAAGRDVFIEIGPRSLLRLF
jgi:hypothetical protein